MSGLTSHEQLIADALLAGVHALQAGQPRKARALLEVVADDPVLAKATDLRDVRARACSLLAQACLNDEDATAADRWAMEAMRLLRAEDDPVGLAAVRSLHVDIRSGLDAAQRRRLAADQEAKLATISVDELLADAPTPQLRADRLVKKAQAELTAGRADEAAVVARLALQEAIEHDLIRERTLARTTLARADASVAPSALHDAWADASAHDEFNLVGIIARTAERLGVTLPTLDGPEMEPRRNRNNVLEIARSRKAPRQAPGE